MVQLLIGIAGAAIWHTRTGQQTSFGIPLTGSMSVGFILDLLEDDLYYSEKSKRFC
ncbi:MAG TPA: hypothetical protein VKA98_10695 [Nitrososphaeraceae archaeon]|nr:hypothetical protein [Nitrososphaeraceae archaeon]